MLGSDCIDIEGIGGSPSYAVGTGGDSASGDVDGIVNTCCG